MKKRYGAQKNLPQDAFIRVDGPDFTAEFRELFKDEDWEYGLYVILDMHDAPGGQTGDNIDDSYGYP